MNETPKYLQGYEDLYGQAPRAAAVEWFRQARFGLFLHYGLYSLLAGQWRGRLMPGKGAEWTQLVMDIPVAEYAKLKDDFTAERFDAAQVAELCRYRLAAGVWLDGIGSFKGMDDGVRLSRAQELYDQIHAAQPQILVSYKQGLTYTEDFFAPEREIREGTLPSDGRPYEICTTLQRRSWGYKAADDGPRRDAGWVMDQLAEAAAIPANLLLNTGPKDDGSIPEEDIATLCEVGERLQAE